MNEQTMLRVILNIYRWIFARPIWLKFNMLIFHLGLRGLGILNSKSSKVSGEEYFIDKILPTIINKDSPVFFDVGANVGNYTLLLLKTYPNAKIYAFEPHPHNFSDLKSNVCSSNVKLHNVAIGESQGILKLYDRADIKGGTPLASLHKSVISELHKQDTIEFTVSMNALDEFCEREEIDQIDFMKIDTEGHELAVLHGAKTLIDKGRIKCLQFEFNEMNIVSRVFFRDFRKILACYELYRLLPHGLILLKEAPIYTEQFGFQNIIAIPKDRKIKFRQAAAL